MVVGDKDVVVVAEKQLDLQNMIKNFKITTKDDAIGFLHFMAKMKTPLENLKKKATIFLTKRCDDCANHFNSDNTIEATKVVRSEKIYNDPALDEMEQDMIILKNNIAARKLEVQALHKIGTKNDKGEDIMTEVDSNPYYKIKNI